MNAKLRARIVPAALVAALAILALVFHAELIAWFTGGGSGGGTSPAAKIVAGELAIETRLRPDPPREHGNHAVVAVRDARGAPVVGAKVRVGYVMPAMGAMPEMRGGADAIDAGGGSYTAAIDVPMGGTWTLEVAVTSAAASATARYTFTVGTSGLTPVGGDGAGAGSADVAYYTCAMHPAVRQDHPGQCPICSMQLHPVTRGEQASGVIRVDPNRRAQLGIRTDKVVRGPMTLEISAPGRITFDETRLEDVTLKVSGYVTDLKIRATGQAVRKGDPLFSLYSPELYAAEQEYALARQGMDATHAAGGSSRNDYLVAAVEKKLRLWGLTPEQIAALAAGSEPHEKVPFASPASGVVIEKAVVEGDAVTAGQRLFRIAALDQIWVEADVYEADLPRITRGQPARVSLSYLQDRSFDGKVAFIYPYLDPASRTGRVRIALPNKGLELKPDMYATVAFQIALGERVQVPATAVIYTGPRRLVFVDLGDGRLRPQQVTVGARSGDLVEIVAGLTGDETIVTSGNFLVAAESRIRGGTAFWEDTDVRK